MLDCGAGFDSLAHIKKIYDVDEIYLTHHHIDHIWGVSHFPEAKVHINPLDFKKSPILWRYHMLMGCWPY